MLLSLLLASSVQAAAPAEYQQSFSDLSTLLDGAAMNPGQMMRGSWLSIKYFSPAADGRMAFNKEQFIAAETPGRAAVSGLFLAIHGDAQTHLMVRTELETQRLKRRWLWLNFGTEEVFFRRLKQGTVFQPLTRTLPSTDGLRAQLRLMMQSRDALVRRAGLFWGSWLADDGYRWGLNYLAENDPDPITRACAVRLLTIIR